MMEPAEFSLFGGVDPGEVPKLLARFDAHEESFEKGELLFREGDVPHEVGLVLSGALHVMQDDFWGNASIVSEVGEGACSVRRAPAIRCPRSTRTAWRWFPRARCTWIRAGY